jgi:hypothetical protein
VRVSVGVTVALAEWLGVCEADAVRDADGVVVHEDDAEMPEVRDDDDVRVGETVRVFVPEADGVAEEDAVVVEDAVAVGVGEGDTGESTMPRKMADRPAPADGGVTTGAPPLSHDSDAVFSAYTPPPPVMYAVEPSADSDTPP